LLLAKPLPIAVLSGSLRMMFVDPALSILVIGSPAIDCALG
jgi:hypothetical protein